MFAVQCSNGTYFSGRHFQSGSPMWGATARDAYRFPTRDEADTFCAVYGWAVVVDVDATVCLTLKRSELDSLVSYVRTAHRAAAKLAIEEARGRAFGADETDRLIADSGFTVADRGIEDLPGESYEYMLARIAAHAREVAE